MLIEAKALTTPLCLHPTVLKLFLWDGAKSKIIVSFHIIRLIAVLYNALAVALSL